MISKRAKRRHGRSLPIGSGGGLARATNGLAILFRLDADLIRKFARYFVVGGTCALIDWSVFAVIFYGFEVHYLIAGTISFVISTGLNYFLSVIYVFGSGKRSRRSTITLVYIASAIGIIINLPVLSGLIEFTGLHAMLAKIAGTGTTFGWNFCARYYWIFDK